MITLHKDLCCEYAPVLDFRPLCPFSEAIKYVTIAQVWASKISYKVGKHVGLLDIFGNFY